VTAWRPPAENPRHLTGHGESEVVSALAWHPNLPTLVTVSYEGAVRLWDIVSGNSRLFSILEHAELTSIDWSPDGLRFAISDSTGRISILDAGKGDLLQQEEVFKGSANSVRWSSDGRVLVTGGDSLVKVLATSDLRLIRELSGHHDSIQYIDLSPDGRRIASASDDATVRIWDAAGGKEIAVLEGHTSSVRVVRFSPNAEYLASGMRVETHTGQESTPDVVRLWRCSDWQPVATLARQVFDGNGGLAFHPAKPLLAVMEVESRRIDCYGINYALLGSFSAGPGVRRYGNAKVVLLGDTGVGKSGLGLVLSGQPYKPTDSTHGRNVWMLDAQEVLYPDGGSQTREVLLWDLAGQPGYRLVHQLHLNEVAVALIVFDSRSETDPFSGVKYWARALTQARKLEESVAVPMKAYLVAARADRGGVGVSAERVRAMVDDLGLDDFFETSAKEGWHVTELAEAIRDGIDWDALPVISSNTLFESIRQFLIEEKQQGRLLCTVDDLFRGFRRARPDHAEDEGLRASFEVCVGRVESRGLIRRLHFGDLVLLQPELLDAYASGMVQAARDEPDGLGFIAEDVALGGRFRLAESERIADQAQEKLLLIATAEELLRHEIALKEVTEQGVDLVFPSQFTRERPDAPDIPGQKVTFAFEGPLPSIYATLAVRLSHSRLFERQDMWQNAASYTAIVGGMCGIHLHEIEEGRGELVLFYDQRTSRTVRSQFETYVADHLRLRALPGSLTRRASRSCPGCGYVLPEDIIRRRLERGASTARCPVCDEAEISLLEEAAGPAGVALAEMNRSADERRDQNAAELRIRGKIETGDFDVFLCHNSKDKAQVMAIGERLKERGILPWLDTWEIRPGTRWQQELQKHIKSVSSAAVFIGPAGAGPWQDVEVEALLTEIANRRRPLIPVILEGRKGQPRLPSFLKIWHEVDMRQPDPDPFEQLVWGITGERKARV